MLNLTMAKYLGSKEVKRQLFKADSREPEWVVYDSTQLVMQVKSEFNNLISED